MTTMLRASSRDERRREVRRSRFRRTSNPNDPLNRLIGVFAVIAIVGATFVAFLIDLQIMRPERYREVGESQRAGVRSLEAYRGKVEDRNGFVLASSTQGHNLIVDPSQVESPAVTAELLAPLLGMNSIEVLDYLVGDGPEDRYEMLATNIDDSVETALLELRGRPETAELTGGLYLQPSERRIYPADQLAKPIVGRVDTGNEGIYGVEAQFDEAMIGIPGEEQFERGRFGSISGGQWDVTPGAAGYDVVLTIDHRIQYVVEEALLQHCEETGAKGLTAVLSDPATSEILAMASVDRDDEGCLIPRHNMALTEQFEPGSVLKPISIAAAVEDLGFTSATSIEVPPSISIGGHSFRDDPTHPAAPYSMANILSDSMNVGTIKVAQQVGPGRLHDYLTRFGFGSLTGVGAKGEESGLVRPVDEWRGSDAGSIPIGQGITVTAAQLAAAYNVFANDGVYQPLSLVRGLRSPDGDFFPPPSVPGKPALRPETAAEVTNMLVGVVGGGTGKSAQIDRYTVAGKTGTAWKVFEDTNGVTGYGQDGNRRYVATFAGYVPAHNPRLSMVIVVDEPQQGWAASTVAAPVFSDVALYALRILGVPPDDGSVDPGARVKAEPAASQANPELDSDGAEVVPVGDAMAPDDGAQPSLGQDEPDLATDGP